MRLKAMALFNKAHRQIDRRRTLNCQYGLNRDLYPRRDWDLPLTAKYIPQTMSHAETNVSFRPK